MASVKCKTCSQEVNFDATKLPKQVVSFSCPACKAKITYDNRPKGARMTISNITLRPMQKEELADLNLNSEAGKGSGPTACILFQDGKIAPLLAAGLEELGFIVGQSFSDQEKAADFVRRETPDLLLIVVPELDGPPSTLVNNLLMILPATRRKIFVAAMADNVRSNDGNAAFLYGVNCLIAKSDVDHFHHILYDYLKEHRRLYHHFNRLEEKMHLA